MNEKKINPLDKLKPVSVKLVALRLDEATFQALEKHVPKSKRSQFIRDAIAEYLQSIEAKTVNMKRLSTDLEDTPNAEPTPIPPKKAARK